MLNGFDGLDAAGAGTTAAMLAGMTSNRLEQVVEAQKRHVRRNRIAAVAFALGVAIGAVAIESSARTLEASSLAPTLAAFQPPAVDATTAVALRK